MANMQRLCIEGINNFMMLEVPDQTWQKLGIFSSNRFFQGCLNAHHQQSNHFKQSGQSVHIISSNISIIQSPICIST